MSYIDPNSRHHLPLNSMLFESTPDLRTPLLPANPTLVNLRDAADTSITALPAVPPKTECKPSFWARLLAKIKNALGGRKEEEMEIGEPTHFRHHGTGGGRELRKPVRDGRGGRGGEEDTRALLRD
jgi:hypothetical protein